MARIATKTTYGYEVLENAGDEPIKIRRKIVEGQEVPESIQVKAGDVEETEGGPLAGYQSHQIRGSKEGRALERRGAYGDTSEGAGVIDAGGNDGAGEDPGPGGSRPSGIGADEADEGYDDMTVHQLRAEAGHRGLDVPHDAKKADLVKALEADDE